METMVDPRLVFPDPRDAADHGLVAIGGDYHPLRLMAAYASGIFPWPSEEMAHAWFSPDPRMVLRPADLWVSRSLRKTIARGGFEVRYDTAFATVIEQCAAQPRPEQDGTWICDELIQGFLGLHAMGLAHSVETWRGERLVGGLYGISLGAMFCGESMFFTEPNASKIALVHLAGRLQRWRFPLIDCQVYTEHLAHFGAREWPRDRFLDLLHAAMRRPTRRGAWT